MENKKSRAPTERSKIIKVRMVKTYQELKDLNQEGNFIFLRGNIELVFDPAKHDVNVEDSGKMHTISIEGKYFIYNIYNLYTSNDIKHLYPFMKHSAKIGSGTGLNNRLKKVAIKGGLMRESGVRLRQKDVLIIKTNKLC